MFGVFAAGMILNDGERRNLFSIAAAVLCIPAAMSAVSMIMMWMRKPVTSSFAGEMQKASGDARLLMELYVTTKEHGLYLHAAVIRDNRVAAFVPDERSSAVIEEVSLHLRSALNQSCGPVQVFLTKDPADFREQVAEMSVAETTDPELQEEIAQILLSLSL